MKKTHIFINKAFVYTEKKVAKEPKDCAYNTCLGAWLWGKEFLMKSLNPLRPLVGTKKADIETGEDQKGE